MQTFQAVSYFPTFANDKFKKHGGVSAFTSGIIFGGFDIAAMVGCAFLHDKTLTKFGKKCSFLYACFVAGLMVFAQGLMVYMPDDYPKTFIVTMFIIRMFFGYADSLIQTATYSLISQTFPD